MASLFVQLFLIKASMVTNRPACIVHGSKELAWTKLHPSRDCPITPSGANGNGAAPGRLCLASRRARRERREANAGSSSLRSLLERLRGASARDRNLADTGKS